jgi:predicted alpha/beta hydrolase family esterase
MTHALLLDGWQYRRAPLHWQGWLAEQLAADGWSVDYATLPEPERPEYEGWAKVVRDALNGREDVVVIAHGLSVLLWLRMCAEDAGLPPVERGLLVAPPASGAHGGTVSEYVPDDAAREGLSRVHRNGVLLVTADDDPYLPGGAETLARTLDVRWVRLPSGGHLNTASGHGPWPDALAWCRTGAWPAVASAAAAAPAAPAAPDDTLDPTGLDAWLEAVYAPSGHRLGILSVAADASSTAAVDRRLTAAGLRAERRHARLQPRPGEQRHRPGDVADFARRYGHEYSAAVLSAGSLPDDGDQRLVTAAFTAEGVAVQWV